jgi:hypothetical protein
MRPQQQRQYQQQQQPRIPVPSLRPGRGVPIKVSENDYDGSANSSEFSPAYNSDVDSYYADFRVKCQPEFYRMYGKSADEVVNYIEMYKDKYETKKNC